MFSHSSIVPAPRQTPRDVEEVGRREQRRGAQRRALDVRRHVVVALVRVPEGGTAPPPGGSRTPARAAQLAGSSAEHTPGRWRRSPSPPRLLRLCNLARSAVAASGVGAACRRKSASASRGVASPARRRSAAACSSRSLSPGCLQRGRRSSDRPGARRQQVEALPSGAGRRPAVAHWEVERAPRSAARSSSLWPSAAACIACAFCMSVRTSGSQFSFTVSAPVVDRRNFSRLYLLLGRRRRISFCHGSARSVERSGRR